MDPGEAYLEVGSYKGLSLTGAMLGNEKFRFYAVESFREFGVDPRQSRKELVANVSRWVPLDNLTLLEGDSFRLLWKSQLIKEPVDVYFYDGIHGGVAQYLALAVVEPLLADEALVDNRRRFLAGRPESYEELCRATPRLGAAVRYSCQA
jgi:hypothetical protein